MSLFNTYNEEEILLEPERKFRIENINPEPNDIVYIIWEIFDSPIVLDNLKIHSLMCSQNMLYNSDKLEKKFANKFLFQTNIQNNPIIYSHTEFLESTKIEFLNELNPLIKKLDYFIYEVFGLKLNYRGNKKKKCWNRCD